MKPLPGQRGRKGNGKQNLVRFPTILNDERATEGWRMEKASTADAKGEAVEEHAKT